MGSRISEPFTGSTGEITYLVFTSASSISRTGYSILFQRGFGSSVLFQGDRDPDPGICHLIFTILYIRIKELISLLSLLFMWDPDPDPDPGKLPKLGNFLGCSPVDATINGKCIFVSGRSTVCSFLVTQNPKRGQVTPFCVTFWSENCT
jgi:hypothetical protein